MSNGLGSFKHLGLCWCAFVASFTALADFTLSDSQVLASIAAIVVDIERDTDSMQALLTDIAGDTSSMSTDVYDIMRDVHLMQGDLHSIRRDFLVSITNSLGYLVRNTDFDFQHSLYTHSNDSYNSLYVHDVRNDDIYRKLGDLQDSVNNLTNYFCYSPEYIGGSSAVFTNLAAMLQVPSLSNYDTDGRWLFYYLFGRHPTNSEITSWRVLYEGYGLHNLIFKWYASTFDLDAFNGTSLAERMWNLLDDLSLDRYPYGDMGKGYNFLYGTRQLTDTSIGISNVVSRLNQNFSNIFNSVQGEYSGAAALNESLRRPIVYDGDGTVRNDSIVVNAAVSLSDSWEASVPGLDTNNIAQVNTNDIMNISDNDYQGQLNKISSQSILSDPLQEELSGAVQSINQQIVSFFPIFDDNDELVLDFGTISIFDQQRAVSFTFSRLPALYWSVQSFFLATLKVICLMLSVQAIYNHIAVESSM